MCKLSNWCKIQLLSLEVLIRSYLKENEIRIKNGTDVNAVMRDMMSVILEIP